MKTLKILNSKEVKTLIHQLTEQFGLINSDFFKNHMFLVNNKKKVFISTKNEPDQKFRYPKTEKVGLYFATINKDSTLRLSLEGSQIVGKLASKNILELNTQDAENWLKGFDFDVSIDDGYYILKYKQDFIGCGLIRNNKLFNFLPKTRRLKSLYS